MKAGKVAGEDRGGVERRNGQYEKEEERRRKRRSHS